MKLKYADFEEGSPYLVELKTWLPYPLPPIDSIRFENNVLTDIVYRSTKYIYGDKKLMIHHEPRALPGYYIKLDKGWNGKEQRWPRGTPYRFIVQNITENIIGYIYLEEIQCYTRGDASEETDMVPYEKSIYAGFMVQEVSKEEFRKLQKQKRDAVKK